MQRGLITASVCSNATAHTLHTSHISVSMFKGGFYVYTTYVWSNIIKCKE